MKAIKRYNTSSCGDVEISKSGDFVYYDDYENLQIEYEDLQGKYDRLVEKLGNLYVGS